MATRSLFKKILLFEYVGFSVVILLLWLDEVLDLPSKLFSAPPTPVNVTECVFESGAILLLAMLIIYQTSQILNRIEHITMYDPLTNLMNRRFLLEYLKHKVRKPSRSRRPFSIIMCDIDNFKKINDRFGHDCGDSVLLQIANILKEQTRPQDFISRWGGEEFLIFLPDMLSENAFQTAERLRGRIARNVFSHGELKLKLTMSFGVSDHYYGDPGSDKCIKTADMHLYHAKQSGKNKVIHQSERTFYLSCRPKFGVNDGYTIR